MDLRDQLDAEMNRPIGFSPGPGTTGDRGSEGISRYPIPQRSGGESVQSGIPQDKIGITDGQNTRANDSNLHEDSQDVKEMYEKFMGNSPG